MKQAALLCICMAVVVHKATGAFAADESARGSSQVCWPLHFSGVVLGITRDTEVQRILGKGAHRPNQGDAGGRYFVDAKRTATLHVVSFTDATVGQLTLSQGVDPAIRQNELEAASSTFFDPNHGFGNWHALRLGSSKTSVLENLGPPEGDQASNDWKYSSACTCELPEYLTITFREGRVYRVMFSAPPG